MNEEMRLMLRSNQLIIRDRNWNCGEREAKALAIDQQITDLLNPKKCPGLAERTHDALKLDVKTTEKVNIGFAELGKGEQDG